MEQIKSIDLRTTGDGLSQVGQSDEQQQDERYRCQERVEREGTCEERDVVFVRSLESAADEAGG